MISVLMEKMYALSPKGIFGTNLVYDWALLQCAMTQTHFIYIYADHVELTISRQLIFHSYSKFVQLLRMAAKKDPKSRIILQA